MKAPAVHFLHQDELPKNVEIKNDMIEQIQIRRDRGFILGCTVHMKSGRQPFLNGYHNTGNIGYILLALAELLGVNKSGECSDLLESFKNTPCRVASNGMAGDIIAETTWLGHFMFDNWMLAKDIVQIGFEKEN